MKNITRYLVIGFAIILVVTLGIVLLSKVKTKEVYKLTKFETVYAAGAGGSTTFSRLDDYEYFYITLGKDNTFTLEFKFSSSMDKNQNTYKYTGKYTKTKDKLVLVYDDYADEIDGDTPRECEYIYNSDTKTWERDQFINITDGDGTSVSRFTIKQTLTVTKK